jgi:hypothetical protein
MKYIFIGYGVGVKGCKLWYPIAEIFLYSRNVIFIEIKPSPIVVWLKDEEKKLLV